MGLRCVDLLNEFEAKGINKRFLYNTIYLKPSDLDEAFLNIKENSSFKYCCLVFNKGCFLKDCCFRQITKILW